MSAKQPRGRKPHLRSSSPDDKAKGAIIKVGDGRGFILATAKSPVIVTAAHCLPHVPEVGSFLSAHERTYPNLIGPLAAPQPGICAECLFVDPVADIAVLGGPDGQELYDEANAYEEFVEAASTLKGGTMAPGRAEAWLFTLGSLWVRCIVLHRGGPLWISDAAEPIEGGMSGSPILDDAGAAIGIVCCAGGVGGEPHTGGGPNPRLADSLPGWLLRQIGEEAK
jgi:hypothetical protein